MSDETWGVTAIVPSRGRPDAVRDLLDCAAALGCGPDHWVISVDYDDPCLPEYRQLGRDARPVYVHEAGISPHGAPGHVWAINSAVEPTMTFLRPAVLIKLDDDHRPRTPGWAQELEAAIEEMGGTGIAYANDLLQGAQLATVPAISADIVRALGYMAPPQLQHLYVDNWWRDLGRDAGCLRYLPEVVVEHMHPIAGKQPWTEGHLRANSGEQYQRDGVAYQKLHADGTYARDVALVSALREGKG